MKRRISRKTSIIWKLTDDELQQLFNTCTTKVELLQKLGLDGYSGNHRTLAKRIEEGSFDLSTMEIKRKNYLREHFRSFKFIHTKETALTKNSTVDRHVVKRLIIKEKLIPYVCAICENTGEWLNSKLSLQLEHKNGVNNDNQLENLCFLCPNCHSQSITYSGKKNKKKWSG